MIKRLRRKFIIVNMAIVTVMLAVIFGLILFFTKSNMEQDNIQMLRSAKPGLRPDLRNRLVGGIPNPRMIANSVVRLSVVSLRWSQSHITKKAGQGRSGIHPFLPCPSHHCHYNSFRCCLAASRSFFRSSP